MRVLIDTNVALDVLLKRSPFYQDSFAIFQLADRERIQGRISAVSVTDIFYLLRKGQRNSSGVYTVMDELTTLLSIIPVTKTTITKALALRWQDFEDAVQYIAAQENGIEYIITRNEADYETSEIHCISPTDFIAYTQRL